jgi:hypothetical protein
MLLQTLKESLLKKNRNIANLLAQLDLVIIEFEKFDLPTKLKNVKSLLFCIEQISKTTEITKPDLEKLATKTKNLKQYTFDSDYYPKVYGSIYKQMFLLIGDSKRKILLKKAFKVDVETGIIVISSTDIESLESIETKYLESLNDKLFIIETGGDGPVKLEIELIDMNFPFLSVADYRKEILNSSDLITVNFESVVNISDGAEQNLKNVLETSPGKYDCAWYEFETKYKVVMVKKS